MATKKQIAANRRNSRKSTGPKTNEGKATVRHNAVTHGLTGAAGLVLPAEEETFLQLSATLREEWSPRGARENLLIDRMAVCALRLHRVPRIETSLLLAKWHYVTNPNPNNLVHNPAEDTMPPEATLGRAWSAGSQIMTSLSRHERQLERSLAEATRELEMIQYARTMQCSRFYARNVGKFPPLGNVRITQEGSFGPRAREDTGWAPGPSAVVRRSENFPGDDILTPPEEEAP